MWRPGIWEFLKEFRGPVACEIRVCGPTWINCEVVFVLETLGVMLVGVRAGWRPVQRQGLRGLSREDKVYRILLAFFHGWGSYKTAQLCRCAHTLGPLSDRNARLCVTMWPNKGKNGAPGWGEGLGVSSGWIKVSLSTMSACQCNVPTKIAVQTRVCSSLQWLAPYKVVHQGVSQTFLSATRLSLGIHSFTSPLSFLSFFLSHG